MNKFFKDTSLNIHKSSQVFLILVLVIMVNYSCQNPTESISNYVDIPDFVLIEKNLSFTMGCQESLGCICVHRDVIPPFAVMLSPYYIGEHEVRNDEYALFVSDSGYSDSTFWSMAGWEYINEELRLRPSQWVEGDVPWIGDSLSFTPDRPINNVSWYEAEAYCNWLSKTTGNSCSLPTEAQWERAARGPDPGRVFAYGNEHDASSYNNFFMNNALEPVVSVIGDMSRDGCFDMAGNVLEYCSDLYEVEIYQSYKDNEPVRDPMGPETNYAGARVVRGLINLFHYDRDIEFQIQTVTRANLPPDLCVRAQGFRVVIKTE